MRFWFLAGLAVLFAVPTVAAPPPELSMRVSARQPAGCADYGWLFFSFYRAELWTDADDLPGRNFGLSLTYLSSFEHEELVSSSISEMVRMSGRPPAAFAAARAQLEQAFRAVRKGDRYTAWRSGPGQVEFFRNGTRTGALTHDADLFLAIWLGPSSRDPGGRDALLSGRCDD